MRQYRTIQGDTWDVIAYREYANENLVSVLIEANEEYCGFVKFPAGIILDVPEIISPKSATLPPWKE